MTSMLTYVLASGSISGSLHQDVSGEQVPVCQSIHQTYLKLMVKGKPQGLDADLGVRVRVRDGSIVKLPGPSQPGMSESKSRLLASEELVSLSVRRQSVKLAVCSEFAVGRCGVNSSQCGSSSSHQMLQQLAP